MNVNLSNGAVVTRNWVGGTHVGSIQTSDFKLYLFRALLHGASVF
jgi:hypothetical protein